MRAPGQAFAAFSDEGSNDSRKLLDLISFASTTEKSTVEGTLNSRSVTLRDACQTHVEGNHEARLLLRERKGSLSSKVVLALGRLENSRPAPIFPVVPA